MNVGIEKINFYGGSSCINVRDIFSARNLDISRSANLMMDIKSVGLPCEDSVTNGVNAAKPIVDQLSESDKQRIEMVITSSESGVDFGKSLSTYIHDYLGLSRHCRLFEVKQACYGGTAALQMAATYIASGVSPGAKVLVIATDVARTAAKRTYAEPTQATGAIAMLLSNNCEIMELDLGANGLYSYEVMDTCRPLPDVETGDPDLSLLSYLDCLDNSFQNYCNKVEDADFYHTFDYLAFHTPFPGMVKGAHRKMMRDLSDFNTQEIDSDFEKRLSPALHYCSQVGNIYSATLYMGLCSLIDNAELGQFNRIGLFSYGSGCSSEFFSGIVRRHSKVVLREMRIQQKLSERYKLNMEEYEHIIDLNTEWMFGIKNKSVNFSSFSRIYEHFFAGRGLLVLKGVNEYHREYGWS
ncbi:hydroxymethylglutaryl-CoA synthase family protein [Paenibacillus sp. NPDC055715]